MARSGARRRPRACWALVDPATGDVRPAHRVVADLLGELRDDLEQAGKHEEVTALVARLLTDGTSATRQRAVFHRTGELPDVTASVLRDAATRPRGSGPRAISPGTR